MSGRHQVVIIGSGFGGLFAAKALKRADVDVTLVAKTSHHLFQPLLYQVATGVLSQGEIAPSTREILSRQKNTSVLLGDVIGIDLERRVVTSRVADRQKETAYDSLILAAGAGQSYFGNDQFADYAPGMKSIDDALELRARIFGAFELAELSDDPDEVRRLLTFVVVGAGPTGVEMAGQIAELAHRALVKEYRRIDTSTARVDPPRCRSAGAPRLWGEAGRQGCCPADQDRRRGQDRRDGHRCQRRRDHGEGRRRHAGTHRGGHQDLGSRGVGESAGEIGR